LKPVLARILQFNLVSIGKSGDKKMQDSPQQRVENQAQCAPGFRGCMPREAHLRSVKGKIQLNFSG